MRRLMHASVLLLCAILTAQQKPTLSDAQKQKLDALVRKLGSDDFATREQALAALKELLLRLNGLGKTEALRAYLKQKIESSRDAQIKEHLERLWVIVRFGVTDALLKALPDLLERLTSPLKEERLQMISRLEKLWREGVGDAAKPLIGLLKDVDADVHRAAAYALSRIGGKEVIEALIAALKDKSADVRRAAAKALGTIKAKEAVKPLIAVLKGDKDSKVRCEAANALGHIGGEEVVKTLIAALKDKDNYVRWSAAHALRGMKAKETLEPLMTALKNKDWRVRQAAAYVLGEMRAKEAVEPLIAMLKNDKDWRIRSRAAYALGRIKAKGAVEPLIAALKDANNNVRYAAAVALGNIRAKEAVKPLIEALKDKGWNVRWAVYALTEITGKNFGKDYNKWLKWWQEQQNSNKEKDGAGTAR